MNALDGFLPLIPARWEKRTKQTKYLNDPVAWAIDIAGVKPWKAQREIAYSLRDNRGTAVAAGHGVGKTWWVAVLCAWWVDVHPVDEVFIASTAPSADQVNLLWDNIRMVYANIKRRHAEGIIDHELPGYINGNNEWKLHDGRFIGQGRKPPDQKADVAFQGRHAPYLLAIADEAVGVPAGFIDALGNIASGRNNRQLLIANPTDPTCAMAKIWKDKNPFWKTMHISVMDAPTITPEEGFDPDEMAATGMSGMEYVEQKREEYGGEDDAQYVARVLGQWAFDAGNNLFTEVELARGRSTIVLPDPSGRPELGLDIARGDKDESVIYLMQQGEVWSTDPQTGKPLEPTGESGWRIRKLDSWRKAPLTGGTAANPGTAERAHAHVMGEGAWVLKYDAAGMGSAVTDGLYTINDYQQGRHGYIWFEVYGQSTQNVDRRQYENARAEQFFRMKRLLASGVLDIDPKDETLQEQLRGIVFEYTTQGRIKIESKDDMKKRNVKSPDYADAAWYALYDITLLMDPMANMKPGQRVLVQDEYNLQPSNRVGGWKEAV
jgi:phage terminase large subunit